MSSHEFHYRCLLSPVLYLHFIPPQTLSWCGVHHDVLIIRSDLHCSESLAEAIALNAASEPAIVSSIGFPNSLVYAGGEGEHVTQYIKPTQVAVCCHSWNRGRPPHRSLGFISLSELKSFSCHLCCYLSFSIDSLFAFTALGVTLRKTELEIRLVGIVISIGTNYTDNRSLIQVILSLRCECL